MHRMQSTDRHHQTAACLVAAVCAMLVQSAALAAQPSLSLDECRLESGSGSGSVAARCATLEVPENPTDAAGKQIGLRVAVIPALRSSPEPDPLFVLSGGPGQAASDFYVAMAPALARIRRDRDIVVLDQRGTGRSHKLNCPLPNDADLTEVDSTVLRSVARKCLEALTGDARFYTTSVAVRDLEAVRAALGYERLNLYGVSYGTRVAQHYLRRYPNRVRAMVLDGAVPPQLALGPHIPRDAQRALDALFARCASEAACQKAFPQLEEQFAKLRDRLREPLKVALAHPTTAAPIVVRFGVPELNAVVRLLSYSDESASILPLLIHEAQVFDQPQALAAQYEIIKRDLQEQLAYGMHFSVVCSEDAPRWSGQGFPSEAIAETYIGDEFMTAMRAVCDLWPRGPVDEDFYTPIRSTVPTLIMSGENDPVTPPAYGEQILPGLTNGLHIVLEGQGHGQLAAGCIPRVVSRFIASASVSELGEECAHAISAAPFMISSTGPSP